MSATDLDGEDHPALRRAATEASVSIPAALTLAERLGRCLPLPGSGRTLARWADLAAVTAADVTVGRVVEAHTDAVAILREAGEGLPGGTWGVFAAEGSGHSLHAVEAEGGWCLQGTKPWCSLAGVLDHALVTAAVTGGRGLFAVDLRQSTVTVEPVSVWKSRGLVDVPSTPVAFEAAPARPVGDVDWYLRRRGFGQGGIGVAACWYGAASAMFDHLVVNAKSDDLSLLGVGAADLALATARSCLVIAATEVDAGRDNDALVLRTRGSVAQACVTVLDESARTLGPAPLSFDGEHARRVADLRAYLGQHHGQRDGLALGRLATR